jgi:ribosomal protein L7/L12
MDLTIRSAENGYIVCRDGKEFIAADLLAAARLVGEIVPNSYCTYQYHANKGDLVRVRSYFEEGKKIEAIKALRNAFNPTLGLREAKDIVETLMG